MISVRFLTVHAGWPWLRQFPNSDGMWGNVRFKLSGDHEECDFLVVFDQIAEEITIKCAPENTLFLASEPSNVKRYRDDFLRQFATVLTTDRDTAHPNKIYGQPGLPWQIGINHHDPRMVENALRFGDLVALFDLPKTKEISVICSDKVITAEHERRLAFVRRLTEHFGDRIDLFGRGFNEIPDKAEALVPYRYHVALDSCDFQDYWTEKLADPIIAGTLPIYWGCRNIEKYFPQDSFVRIDIDKPDEAMQIIEQTLASDQFEKRREALREARDRVLYHHNLFALLARVIKTRCDEGASRQKQQVTIRPEWAFAPFAVRMKIAVRRALEGSPRVLNAVIALYRAPRTLKSITDSMFPHHDRWLVARGDDTLLSGFPLRPDSLVFDVGGYEGDWTAAIYSRYGCEVYVFEPVPAFCEDLRQRFADHPKIRIFAFGLAEHDGESSMAILGDATSAFRDGQEKRMLPMRDIVEFLEDQGIDHVDLVKINIEGGEFPLLGRLLGSNRVRVFDYILVQFHRFMRNAVLRRLLLRLRLRSTHQPMWTFPFVWECWQRRGLDRQMARSATITAKSEQRAGGSGYETR